MRYLIVQPFKEHMSNIGLLNAVNYDDDNDGTITQVSYQRKPCILDFTHLLYFCLIKILYYITIIKRISTAIDSLAGCTHSPEHNINLP